MKILTLSLDGQVADKDSPVAKRMVEYGKLVDVFTVLVLDDADSEVNLSQNVKVISVKKSNKAVSLFRLGQKARAVLKEEKYDIITVQDVYFVGRLAVYLAGKFQTGLEVQIHGFEKYHGIRKMLAKTVLRKAQVVRVVSQRLKRLVMDDFGVAEEKITVVPIYTPVIKLKSYQPEADPPWADKVIKPRHDAFIFLTVGRLVPVKNVEMQINAMKEIAAKFPQVELWIVGNGPESDKLKVKSKKLENVKFFGWQNDLDTFYSQADAFLLTSNSEGWGLSVVEAAAHGLPIIMTDVGLSGEVIKNNESGLIISVNDCQELVKAMALVIEDKTLRKKLSEGAKVAISKLPTKVATLQLYIQSWRKIISRL